MSDIAPAITAPPRVLVRPKAATREVRDRRFYLIMAIASTFLVFVGFARTFYLRAYFGTPQLQQLTTLLQIHGIVFTTWMVFFVVQTALIVSNRPEIHRRLGYAGAVLACAMLVLATTVAFNAERLGHKPPIAPDPETNFLISLGDILTFSIFIAAGFIWRHNREAHQRLMLLATVAGLMSAAIARLPVISAHPPAMALIGLTFLFAGPIYRNNILD